MLPKDWWRYTVWLISKKLRDWHIVGILKWGALLFVAQLVVVTAVVMVMALNDGDERTPQSPTPTLSKEEAWAIVTEKVATSCPRFAPRMTKLPDGYYADGAWHFTLQWEAPGPTPKPLRWWQGLQGLTPTPTVSKVQFAVYETTRAVTGDTRGLQLLGGVPPGCRP